MPPKWKGQCDSGRKYSPWRKDWPWAWLHLFSERDGKIKTSFVTLAQVVRTTGVMLFEAVQSSLCKSKLAICNCIDYSSDGTANVAGEWNSLWSRIKAAAPPCMLIKCTCHSLALCIMKAFEKLLCQLGLLLSDIPKWFLNSSIRGGTSSTCSRS